MVQLPRPYQKFVRDFKEIATAYDQLGAATRAGGPLEEKSCELIKLGIAIGAGLEGAVHSHTRRALGASASPACALQTSRLSVHAKEICSQEPIPQV